MKDSFISLDDLMLGESFKRGNATFPSAAEIVQPYLQNTEQYVQEYRIKAWTSSETAIETQTQSDIDTVREHPIYTRVHIDGILHDEYQISNDGDVHKQVISMLYAIDIQSPIAKVYTGYERSACLNTSIFNPRHITSKRFADMDFDSIFDMIPRFAEDSISLKAEYETAIYELHNTMFAGENLFNAIGRIGIRTVKQPGLMTAYTNMLKFLQSNQDVNGIKNIYFKKDWDTNGYSAYDLYQAMTGTLSNKGMKEPDKIFSAYKLVL
jgi:hypothetical protein